MSTWREVIEYDPLTGVRTDYFNGEDGPGIYTEQDMTVAKAFEAVATELRNDDEYKRKGIKNSWMHAAIIPNWVYNKLISDYKIQNPLAQGKEVKKIIQRDFPWCMTVKGKI